MSGGGRLEEGKGHGAAPLFEVVRLQGVRLVGTPIQAPVQQGVHSDPSVRPGGGGGFGMYSGGPRRGGFSSSSLPTSRGRVAMAGISKSTFFVTVEAGVFAGVAGASWELESGQFLL